ncbi:serine/threonine protein kinase, partial [Streptomyces sp. NPDC052682]
AASRGGGWRGGGAAARSQGRSTPASRGTTRSGSGSRPAPRSGTGRPGSRTTGTGLRPANPRLLRQRLFVFVVVTLLVALGIALVQGCQGPAQGLGGGDGVRQRQEQPRPDDTPLEASPGRALAPGVAPDGTAGA